MKNTVTQPEIMWDGESGYAAPVLVHAINANIATVQYHGDVARNQYRQIATSRLHPGTETRTMPPDHLIAAPRVVTFAPETAQERWRSFDGMEEKRQANLKHIAKLRAAGRLTDEE